MSKTLNVPRPESGSAGRIDKNSPLHPADVRLHFVASSDQAAQDERTRLIRRYGQSQRDATVRNTTTVALGGDGFMLATMRDHINSNIAIFGVNYGTVGFLMNPYRNQDLPERIRNAKLTAIEPLRMTAIRNDGSVHDTFAFNEVAVLRQTYQGTRIRISVDGRVRIPELVADGILVATPAGSTAYNFSAHGPILPLGSKLLALTPISPFRPRRWRGAILPYHSTVEIENLEPLKRPVNVTSDHQEVRDVSKITISIADNSCVRLLFDPGQDLYERSLKEQFLMS